MKKVERISRPCDPNQLAKLIVNIASGETKDRFLTEHGRDRFAVIMGCRGGLKGGVAGAASLSAERRVQIEKKAAAKRWKTDG